MKKWTSKDGWKFVEVDGKTYVLLADVMEELDDIKKIFIDSEETRPLTNYEKEMMH